ncbi:MAG: sigma 54-interacting transcriptional regulator [Deltaproteobacteria bacterium]|nr:sigma 54-interacting transcriptional regulator [Deltaproteobacteria bacterium]
MDTPLPPRYDFRRDLGAGGEGQVSLVADLLRAGEPVVIKRLARVGAVGPAGVPPARLLGQLRREFRLLAGLRHPSLAPVHDFGLLGDGTAYFTRAFVPGEPLAVPETGRTGRQAARALVGICDALEPLHASGLLHGDIKPANVIVEPSGAYSLIDFSLTRPHGAPEDLPSGTVAFMPPELLQGDAIDHRADLYALGILGYALLAGRLPFGPTVAAAIDGHLRLAPPALGLPPGSEEARLAAVVSRLLAKRPAERLPDVREVRAAIRGIFPDLAAVPRPHGCAVLPSLGEGIADVEALAERMLAVADGPPPALLCGEPGSGKSTILRELKWRAQLGGWIVVEAPGAGAPGWRETLDSLLRAADLQAGGEETPALGTAIGSAGPRPGTPPDPRPLSRALAAVASAAAPDDTLLSGVHGALVRWRRGRRTLLLVDDVHRLPAALRPLWRAVACPGAGGAAEDAFPAVFTTTTEDGSGPALFGGEAHHVVNLEPLDLTHVASLVRRARGQDDPELAARLLEWTSGNPALVYEGLLALSEAGVPFLDALAAAPLADRFARLWTDRLERLGPDAARALLALAAAGGTLPEDVLRKLAGVAEDWEAARRTLLGAGFARPAGPGDLVLERADVRDTLARFAPGPLAQAAVALLAQAGGMLPPARRLRVAVAAGRFDRALEILDQGIDALIAAGETRQAAEILEAVLRHSTAHAPTSGSGPQPITNNQGVLARLLDVLERTGEASRALELARLVPAPLDGLPFELVLRRARLASLAGENDEAEAALAGAKAKAADDGQRSAAAAVEARAWLRRGRYGEALAAADTGLALGPQGEDRVELLVVAGMAEDYLGDADRALRRYVDAAETARHLGSARLATRVRAIEAFTFQRSGRFDEAAERYRACLEEARAADDRGAIANYAGNLGSVLYVSGRIGEAMRQFETALAAARWVGRASSAGTTQANLALCLAKVGQYEQALRHAEEAGAAARRSGLRRVELWAGEIVAEVARRRGDLEAARAGFAHAEAGYRALGQEREATEAALHRIECVVLAGQAAPPGELEELARRTEAGGYEDFVPRLRAVQARAALAAGDLAAAVNAADRSFAAARRRGDLEAQAEAASILERALLAGGDREGAEKHRRARRTALEALAADLPERMRTSFLEGAEGGAFDALRAPPAEGAEDRRTAEALRARRGTRRGPGPAGEEEGELSEHTLPLEGGTMDAMTTGPAQARAMGEPFFRLLEINRELVRESDTGRLFDAIMDAAVRFTGAERGFLLSPADGGALDVRCVREFSQVDMPEEHRRFSRSIAEQVYRDGQPVITVSAMNDERFGKVLSVHELQLQSILCVPIRGRERVLGVLYLENRVRRGLFRDSDRELLMAFGDQVALAIENARLIETLRARSRDLELAQGKLEGLLEERGRLLDQRTEQLEKAERDLATARRALEAPHGFSGLIGESPAMRRVFHLMRRVLDTDVPVVLVGESGTGKEVVAKAIHEHGARKKGRFVALNCGAFPEGLIESELFGHTRGAFTGAVRDKKGVFVEAEGGTLLLDEVGDMPAKMQTDLLRTLQERKVRPLGSSREVAVDARVMAASQVPLGKLVEQGKFREDLYYRMSVVEIPIPALRERLDDLPLLVDHFLTAFAARYATKKKAVSREAMRYLMTLPWPGNVRQLEHAILNGWVLAEGDVLTPDDFRTSMGGGAATGLPAATSAVSSRALFESNEREKMLDALRQVKWNKTKAAGVLGMPRRTFYRKLERYGIDR